ncbi:unnamed protein product [Aphanomyces euteiches]|uniref:Spondin-like TSP1 domain-containing protein n=1 Tax=Aphanomyces euteiches TaxID=100861 RepID=A0A6G0X427_9STRA|nr:hypothetical protein Ae201684_008696 [Aphanomyces euteiches]KAH9085330.1 hypothetical protein Ae201684P_005039 [Aphanomyces euteiches]KAH9154039.1 hypothetical protein AeRB84_003810 [Aphanomyces euteiches]
MRIALSLTIASLGSTLAAYSPSELIGVTDPILIAKIEGYMPPICAKLYGDNLHWSDWSNCSATCGQGQQVRYLNGDAIKNLQSNGCEISIDKKNCTGLQCPRDCQYGDWIGNDGKNGGWGACDNATGIQTRTRTEVTSATNGGKDCVTLWGPATQKQNCAVNCEGSYGPWDTKCDGKTATLSRRFNVAVQPLNGGTACPASVDVKDCNPECADIPWGPYTVCDPNTGTRTRTRDLPVDGNWLKLSTTLKTNKCPTIDVQPCDIDCKLSDWDASAVCDVKTGTKTFKRSIIQNQKNCGVPCNSAQRDTLLTKTENCMVSCVLSDWSPWTCDIVTGLSKRTRSILQQPLNGGTPCGDLVQTQDCRLNTCTSANSTSCIATCETKPWVVNPVCDPKTCKQTKTREMLYPVRDAGKPCTLVDYDSCTVDAVMGPWSDWSACDANARKTRTRQILSPACNGGQIAGPTSETVSCQEICLPAYNPWPTDPKTGQEVWGPCNQATGIQTRTRSIVNPPTPGQEPCRTTESRTCAVNCVLDAWGQWGVCDECTGLRNHTRKVLQPMLNGGNQCGPTFESENCAVSCLTGPWSPWSKPDSKCTCRQTRVQFSPPLNGGECVLEQTNPSCVQNCEVSAWSTPEACQTSGPRAGQQRQTRSVLTSPCNGGASCPVLEQWVPCDIDCVLGNWSDFGTCDLTTQTKTATRPVLQPSYNKGKACEGTSKVAPCGECKDLLNPYTYSACDQKTGTRVGTATWKIQPKQGQQCSLSVTETCPVDCDVSAWSAGVCNTKGTLAGQQVFTRTIKTQPLNKGLACPALTKYEKCAVDCKPTDQWGPWSVCNPKTGLQNRSLLIDYPAQNGGSNDKCTVAETKACAVDCKIDEYTGDVVVKSLNGGKSCKQVADALGLPGDYSGSSAASSNFVTMMGQSKEVVMSVIAVGGVGVIFAVGFMRRRRSGYDSVAHA